ncbi:MAG TPA: NYN domain-containing protein [Chloroflexia bacterium]|nr:NYN domain-containing protein [Chloroflexia bacterium]
MEILELAELRSKIGANLQALLPFVVGDHSEENRLLLENATSVTPSIDDNSWSMVAYITGVYGRFMWRHPLSAEQKRGLWQALIWAVWYEQHYRPKMVRERFRDFLNFLAGQSSDHEFLTEVVDDAERLVTELPYASLGQIESVLARGHKSWAVERLNRAVNERLSSTAYQNPQQASPLPQTPHQSHVSQQLQVPQTTRKGPQTSPLGSLDASYELVGVTSAIDRLWGYLDQKFEKKNQETLDRAKSAPNDHRAILGLAVLAGVITRNVVYRYTHGGSGQESLSNANLNDAILLSEYALKHSTGEYVRNTRRDRILLLSLFYMRQRSLDPESIISRVEEVAGDQRDMVGDPANSIWSDLAAVVTRHLSERRASGHLESSEVDQWVRGFARQGSSPGPSATGNFVREALEHGAKDSVPLKVLQSSQESSRRGDKSNTDDPLSFLGEERRAEFQECIANTQLQRVKVILHESRRSLLSVLSRALADSMFQLVLPPRRPFRIQRGRNAPDLFPDARGLIMSADPEERQKGLSIFEEGMRLTTQRDYVGLAREWALFARARTMGLFGVVAEWQEDINRKRSSWEETWNLSVFYLRSEKPDEALTVLRPGVESWDAPFSHLKFALYCGVQILVGSAQATPGVKSTYEAAAQFLVENLYKYPIPECYLAWLVLVDEVQEEVPLIEQSDNLGLFQEILVRPIVIPAPDQEVVGDQIEVLRQRLERAGRRDTWRLWINDYAERHPWYYKAWQWLSEASELAGDLDRAEEALVHVITVQLNQYRQQVQRGIPNPNLKFLKDNLFLLFQFYRRKALHDRRQAAFNRYHRDLPQLWYSADLSNKRLIEVTRDLLEGASRGSEPPPPTDVWATLNAELASVDSVQALAALRQRLETAMEHHLPIAPGQRVARERADFIKRLLSEICALVETRRTADELKSETDRLNKNIASSISFVADEVTLRRLKAIVSAFERVLESVTRRLKAHPTPEVSPRALGAGLPDDVPESSLILQIHNPGPGEITNLRVTCSDSGMIASRQEGFVDVLPEQSRDVIGVPVNMKAPQDRRSVRCRVFLNYDWGIVENLRSEQPVDVPWFSFQEFLNENKVGGREIPNPYIFDKPIDFAKHDPRLFQGREKEMELVRGGLMEGRNSGTPIYFHGIRKVGKTSLLHRLSVEMETAPIPLKPVVVNLFGVDAIGHSLEVNLNTFTENILRDARAAGVLVDDLEAIPASHPNPLVALEPFFKDLRQRVGNKQLVLLLDEFNLLVGEQTTSTLDVLRRVHQSDLAWFILSGWLRPGPMQKACPRTQLFPLNNWAIDFLPKEVVTQVLRVPTSEYGVQVPRTTVQAVFVQTAGNPYHVAKLAYHCITRLNTEHRNVVTAQDVNEISDLLAADHGNFTSSSFSTLVLDREERAAAIRFAKTLGEKNESMPINQAISMFGADIIEELEEKYILELQGDKLKIRSKLLATFLRGRVAESVEPSFQPWQPNTKKVGLFVDFENVWFGSTLPSEARAKDIALLLSRHAEQFGTVVCRWASADRRNLANPTGVQIDLEDAGFQVSFPHEELQRRPGSNKKDAADQVLIERIIDESTHSRPDIYVIVSGDHYYSERVMELLDDGYTVHIVSSQSTAAMASIWRNLEVERRLRREAEGYTASDFFIDDLDEILGPLAVSS